MSRTAAGTKERPGKQVRQKSSLNRSILDQGWGMFRNQLEYKLEWNGGMLLALPPENTSRACPNCEYISEYNRKTQSQFECMSCGYKNNADVVGAINILERGHRLLACGEMVRLGRSKKQEPVEAIQLTYN
jgi:putative transposase